MLVLRPEHDEWSLLAEHPGLYDVALIPAAYCAEYPEQHPRHGRAADRLLRAVPDQCDWWQDPTTATIVSRTWDRLGRADRRRQTAIATCAPPVDLASFAADLAYFDQVAD